MEIVVAGLSIELIRKRVKHVNLRVSRDGQVKVSAPLRCPIVFIRHYLEEKREWIERHRHRCNTPSVVLEAGEMHFFLGKPYELIVYPNMKRNWIELCEGKMQFYMKDQMTLEQKQRILNQWYKHQLQAILPSLIQKWEAMIGVHANSWTIKRMKTRWGSCHPTKKRICLNLHLIQKPLPALEHVIVHELVHLLEASHNQRFYAFMNQFMPEWKINKAQLLEV